VREQPREELTICLGIREAIRRRVRDPRLMLAYLFWHRPAAGAARDRYETALLAFLRRLLEDGAPGLLAARSARVAGLPWLPGDGYEDSYLVRDFAALGALNLAAVDVARSEAHRRIAGAAAFGAGGVYGTDAGEAAHDGAADAGRYCVWLEKPLGTSYAGFVKSIMAQVRGEGTLWRRQLVLGPAPEFRLVASNPIALPEALSPLACRLDPLA
jgi:hypothetical protein